MLRDLGELEEAEDHLREALSILDMGSGDRATTIMAKSALKSVLWRKGDLEPALELARELSDSFCGSHMGVAFAAEEQADAGLLLVLLGRDEEAEAAYRAALAAVENEELGLPHDHPLHASTLARFGELLVLLDRADEAAPLLSQALSIVLRTEGPDSTEALTAQALLGKCLATIDRPDEAETLLLDAWARTEARFGPKSERTWQVAREVAAFYGDWGFPEQVTGVLDYATAAAER